MTKSMTFMLLVELREDNSRATHNTAQSDPKGSRVLTSRVVTSGDVTPLSPDEAIPRNTPSPLETAIEGSNRLTSPLGVLNIHTPRVIPTIPDGDSGVTSGDVTALEMGTLEAVGLLLVFDGCRGLLAEEGSQ